METLVGVVLLVLGAAGASAIARSLEDRVRGPLLAVAVAPAGVLVGTGAALARGWAPLPSALVGVVLVGVLGLTTGMRVQSPRRGPRT